MKEAIAEFLRQNLGNHLCVLICSMIPIIELRGAIPLGAAFGMPFWQNYLISVIGNMLPIPVILLFVSTVLRHMAHSRVKIFNKVAGFILRKAEKNRPKIEKYSVFGLFIFVAIPLPGTGAWTGSLVAALMGMKFWKAMLSVFLGVLAAGIVMSMISYGISGLFQLF